MKPSRGQVLLLALGAAFLVGLWLLGGCYKCNTPDCSELPPGPSPWVETVTKDASYRAPDAR